MWQFNELILIWIISAILIITLALFLAFKTKNRHSNKFFHKVSPAILILSIVFSSPNIQIVKAVKTPEVKVKIKAKTSVPLQVKNNTKNLVYLYLESFEQNYTDESIFPWLTPNLNKLKTKSTVYNNIAEAYGTSWTIAWMIWSQCGYPLITWTDGNNMSWYKYFYSWAKCMWDILKDSWYEMNYYGWADIAFAWKWNFYKSHGFKNVAWYKELLKKNPKLKINDWWFYDDDTLKILYNKFEEKSKAKMKFGLFSLTLDLHWEQVYLSPSCKWIQYKDWKNKALNTAKCTDKLVWDFVAKILNSPYANNTMIVLWSDHLTMNNSALKSLKSKDRKNLFMIIDGAKWSVNSKVWSTYDIWPTILTKLWFAQKNMWYWINLWNPDNVSIYWKYNEDARDIVKASAREISKDLWQFPNIKSWVKVIKWQNIRKIEGKEIEVPFLILKDEVWNTKNIYFSIKAWTPMNEIAKKNKANIYTWVDKCWIIWKIYPNQFATSWLCVLTNNDWKQNIEYIKTEKTVY